MKMQSNSIKLCFDILLMHSDFFFVSELFYHLICGEYKYINHVEEKMSVLSAVAVNTFATINNFLIILFTLTAKLIR